MYDKWFMLHVTDTFYVAIVYSRYTCSQLIQYTPVRIDQSQGISA